MYTYYYIFTIYMYIYMYFNTPCSKYMALTYFFRGGCAIYLTVKNSIPNLPETANVPEDGATLQVQNGPNCAIYPIFNLNSFFRDRTFRSSKRWKSKGDVCSTKVFRGKDFFTTKLLNRWRNHLGQCHPIAYLSRRDGSSQNTEAYLSFTAM